MSVRLMYPIYLFQKSYLHNEKDMNSQMTEEYFGLLKNEMDAIRNRDRGRFLSNQETTSWQSNDGLETNPIFIGAIRQIQREVRDEVMPYLGAKPDSFDIEFHNSWANINGFGAWRSRSMALKVFYQQFQVIQAGI